MATDRLSAIGGGNWIQLREQHHETSSVGVRRVPSRAAISASGVKV